MQPTLLVGGKSEAIFCGALLDRGHPWKELGNSGLRIIDAGGDSKIPDQVKELQAEGSPVVVLLDNDAVQRKREQADVLATEGIAVHILPSDFEATIAPEIVHRALADLNMPVAIEALLTFATAPSPFDAIVEAVEAAHGTTQLGKAALAQAVSLVAARRWYAPVPIYETFRDLGIACGLPAVMPPEMLNWLPILRGLGAKGRLFAGNHVTNEQIAYWDFGLDQPGAYPLPGRFDGEIAICRRGTRFIVRRFERQNGMFPSATWLHVFDLEGGTLTQAHRFRIRGSAHDVFPDEDGNHLELAIQRDMQEHFGIRCLPDGTQQRQIPYPAASAVRSPKLSPNRALEAMADPLRISKGAELRAAFPNFQAHHLTWSPDSRFLAFFGRRWNSAPDFLWVYDLQADTVHRLAGGEQFIPSYWASA